VRRLIATPFVIAALAVLVSFALTNNQPVTLGLWPTGLTLALPLSVAILAAMAAAFFLGAVMLWAAAISARGRARRAEDRARMLQLRLDDTARTSQSAAPLLREPIP